MSNVKTYAEVPHIQYCSFAIHPFDCGSLVMSGPSADFCGSSRRVENQFDGYRFSNWGGSSGTLLVLGSERSCNDNVSIEVAVCAGDPAVAAKVAHGLEKKYGRQWFLLFVNLLGRLKKHDIWY